MRIDKFLKVSRIIKRRTVAKEFCDAGRIKVNGTVQKASYMLKTGDEVEIKFGENISKMRVLKIQEHVLKNEASELYEIIT